MVRLFGWPEVVSRTIEKQRRMAGLPWTGDLLHCLRSYMALGSYGIYTPVCKIDSQWETIV